MKTQKLIIFGTGAVAQIANYYFETDSIYEVVAFTADRDYCLNSTYENKDLVPFDTLMELYSVSDYEIFIALSYSGMNRLRAKKLKEAKAMGYKIASYISSKCTYLSQYPPGENAFIFEDNTIQPFVKIGNNVTIWSGNHIGHHSVIRDHNFISSHVVISGNCEIRSFCFLGVNSTMAHNIHLAEGTLLGAGVVIIENTQENGVYVSPRAIRLPKSSDQIKL